MQDNDTEFEHQVWKLFYMLNNDECTCVEEDIEPSTCVTCVKLREEYNERNEFDRERP